jgi:hypothetical protein
MTGMGAVSLASLVRAVLSYRLSTMAFVAARLVVVEVEAEVWTLFYRDVVVTVQVSLVAVPLLA